MLLTFAIHLRIQQSFKFSCALPSRHVQRILRRRVGIVAQIVVAYFGSAEFLMNQVLRNPTEHLSPMQVEAEFLPQSHF